MSNTTLRFPHHRLDVYRVAMELACAIEELAGHLPQGHAETKDQLRRAAQATVRNIAEGANRSKPRDKAARFTIARGEVGECAATLEMATEFGLVSERRFAYLLRLADRVAAMLRGLVRREERLAREGP